MRKVQVLVSGKSLEELADEVLAIKERGRKFEFVGLNARKTQLQVMRLVEARELDDIGRSMARAAGKLIEPMRAAGLSERQIAAELLA